MRLGYTMTTALLIAGLAACGESPDVVSDCVLDVAGCTTGQYSCPEADNCYGSERLCRDSGECD